MEPKETRDRKWGCGLYLPLFGGKVFGNGKSRLRLGCEKLPAGSPCWSTPSLESGGKSLDLGFRYVAHKPPLRASRSREQPLVIQSGGGEPTTVGSPALHQKVT